MYKLYKTDVTMYHIPLESFLEGVCVLRYWLKVTYMFSIIENNYCFVIIMFNSSVVTMVWYCIVDPRSILFGLQVFFLIVHLSAVLSN